MGILTAIDTMWWWASLSVFIPIVIHLISRGKHKRLTFSTLAFFPKKPPLNHQQIKLSQRRLLMLRLLLILAVLLSLASVFKEDKSNQAQAIHLLSDAWLTHATPEKREALLALLQDRNSTNTAVRLQNNIVVLPEQLKDLKNISTTQFTNTWQNVANWQQLNPSAATEIIVHSTDRLYEFVGEKFTLSPNTQWDIAETTSSTDISNTIELAVVVLQQSRLLQTTAGQKQTKSVLAALTAFNQLPAVKIQIYQHPSQTLSTITEQLSQQVPTAIIQIGNVQTQAIDEITSVIPRSKVINASELGPVDRSDFPIVLANILFDKALNQAFWQHATLSPQIIANNESGINSSTVSDSTDYAESMPAEPKNIPVWLVLFCATLFASERIYSELSAKQSRRLTQNVSANNV